MINALTMDFDHVRSSTATVDGSRIVLTLETQAGPTNVSLPVNEVPRLLVAVSDATRLANAAQKDARRLALPVRRLDVLVHDTDRELLLAVELASGTELVFQINPELMSQFVRTCSQSLEGRPSLSS